MTELDLIFAPVLAHIDIFPKATAAFLKRQVKWGRHSRRRWMTWSQISGIITTGADKLCAAMFVAILTFDSGHARACCSGGSTRSKVT